ncbi:MAG TPA: hypothetical protein VGO57_14395 [Verrucomicrobiae bacterium]
MTTLVKADSKGRVPIRGTKKLAQYLVIASGKGWWVMPAPKIAPPDEIESLPKLRTRRVKGWLMLAKPMDKNKVAAALRADRDER